MINSESGVLNDYLHIYCIPLTPATRTGIQKRMEMMTCSIHIYEQRSLKQEIASTMYIGMPQKKSGKKMTCFIHKYEQKSLKQEIATTLYLGRPLKNLAKKR